MQREEHPIVRAGKGERERERKSIQDGFKLLVS